MTNIRTQGPGWRKHLGKLNQVRWSQATEIGPGYISQDLFLDIPFNSIHRRNQDAINSRLVAVGKVAVPYYNPRCAAWRISTTKGTAPLKILDTLLRAGLEPYST